MFIVAWLKGPSNASAGYIAQDGNGKTKTFPALTEAQRYVEDTIATNKMGNYDAMILDSDQHTVASWTAALPPALQWNSPAPASTTK